MADELNPEVPPTVVAESEATPVAPQAAPKTVFETAGYAAAKVMNAVDEMTPKAEQAVKAAAAKAAEAVGAAAPKVEMA
ncbi:MAG: hypothetical protein ACM3H9_09050, partial [Rhodospirillaceae bacterium]